MTPYEWELFVQQAGSSSTYLDWVTSVEESQGIAQWLTAETGEKYILTKTGTFAQEAQVYGEWLQTRQTTNQLITQAMANAETGAIEVYSGDVIDTATQEVIAKGAAPATSTLGTIASGACAAIGGFVAGVNLYKSNPDFWTALSQTLLPFCYENPTQGGWDNVWNALFPTAVTSDGKTLVPYNAMQALYNYIAQTGVLSSSAFVDISNVDKSVLECPNDPYILYAYSPPIITFNPDWTTLATNIEVINSTSPVYAVTQNRVTYIFYSENPFTIHRTPYEYTYEATPVTRNGITYYYCYGTSNNDLALYELSTYTSNWDVAYLIFHGTRGTSIDGFSKQPNAVVPVENQSIAQTYPDWETYTYYNVEEDEDTGEQTIVPVLWVPLTLPTGNPTPENFFTDKDQDEGQTGDAAEPEQEKVQVLPPNPTTPADPNGNNGDETPAVPIPLNGALAGIFHVYNPTLSELQALNQYMWTDNIAKLLAEIFNNNPVDAIIGLQSLYATPHIGGRANIKLGYMDSGVASDYVDEQFINIDCGSKIVPEYFQTAYDYEPYTKVYCYLPFIGIRQLSPYDIIGSQVSIRYTIDVLTGVCCAKIYVSKGANNALLYTFEGSCASELPMTAGSRANQIKSTVGGMVGGAVSGAMMGGVPGAVIGGVVGGIGGAARGADVTMSGSLTGVAGACAPRIPFIIVKRTKPYNAYQYNKFYGNPANATVKLRVLSGFTRVRKVHVDTISKATNEEKVLIRDMLMSGVII